MSCSTSSGKLGTLKWGCISADILFWQAGYGATSELCPRTATASLGAVFSSLPCTQLYRFFGEWRADGGEFWKVSPHGTKKFQCVRNLRGWSHKIVFNIHTWVWKPEINSFPNLYVNYKPFWQQSFWYWDTELLWESFAGQSRVVDRFFSTYCWEVKAEFLLLG